MAMEHFELWVAIAAVWVTQMKLMWDVREIKSVLIIKKKGCLKKGLFF